MSWTSQTTMAARAFAAGAILLATGSGQSSPANSAGPISAEQQLQAIVRAYVVRTMGLQPMEEIKLDLGTADDSGLRRAVVRLGNPPSEVTEVLYLTSDGKEVLRGTLDKLSADPWREVRLKLEPVVRESPYAGSSNAAVTIVEFGDFQCPYCHDMNGELDRLLNVFPGRVRWVFADFPLQVHLWSAAAAAAGECVAAQNSSGFWAFEHLVFEHQLDIKSETCGRQLRDFAIQAGVKPAGYDQCVSSPEVSRRVGASVKIAEELGVANTPTLFINGRKLAGAVSFDVLKAAVENELLLRPDANSLAKTR